MLPIQILKGPYKELTTTRARNCLSYNRKTFPVISSIALGEQFGLELLRGSLHTGSKGLDPSSSGSTETRATSEPPCTAGRQSQPINGSRARNICETNNGERGLTRTGSRVSDETKQVLRGLATVNITHGAERGPRSRRRRPVLLDDNVNTRSISAEKTRARPTLVLSVESHPARTSTTSLRTGSFANMNIILMCLVLAGAASAGPVPGQFHYPDYMYEYPVHYAAFAQETFPHRVEAASFATAVCRLVPSTGQHVSGEIYFHQADPAGPVELTGTVSGITPGYHGFHVHQNGNTSDDCKAAGSHFNPSNKNHGAPQDSVRHAGDLGNIVADDHGNAQIAIADHEITLDQSNPRGIIGRAIVVHAKQDDLGKGNDAESLKTGNAGSRLACCVIEAGPYARK